MNDISSKNSSTLSGNISLNQQTNQDNRQDNRQNNIQDNRNQIYFTNNNVIIDNQNYKARRNTRGEVGVVRNGLGQSLLEKQGGVVRNNQNSRCCNPFTHENLYIRYGSILSVIGGIVTACYFIFKPKDPTPPVIDDVGCLNKMDGQYDKLQPDQLLIDPNCNHDTTSFFSDRGNYLIEQTVNNYIKPSRDFDEYTGRTNSDGQYKMVETWLTAIINKFKAWAKIDFVGDGPDTTISQDISTDNKYYTSCSTLKKIMDKVISNIENKKQQKLSPSEIKVISDRYITSVVNKTQLGKVERNFVIRELQISKPKKQFITKKV